MITRIYARLKESMALIDGDILVCYAIIVLK